MKPFLTPIVLLICLSLSAKVFAQKRVVEGVVLTGIIRDSLTQKPIKNVAVHTIHPDKQTVSDARGQFSIIMHAMPDSIYFYHKKYNARKTRCLKVDSNIVLSRKK